MAKNKYYAVAVGRVPGIYFSWPDCQAQTNGYTNAQFKGFPDMEDAEKYIQDFQNGVSGKSQEEQTDDLFAKEYAGRHVYIYVDGSYNGKTNSYGYGVYVEDEASPKVFVGGGPCEFGGNNIEGEIKAATIALDYAKRSNKYDSVTICHDLKHIGLIGDHVETPHTPYTMDYGAFVDKVRKSGLAVDFIHTKGHTGIKGNEYVDKLAKMGCDIPLTQSEQKFISQLKDVDGFPKKRELPDLPEMGDETQDEFHQ